MFGAKDGTEPEVAEVLQQRRPSHIEATQHMSSKKTVSNRGLTGASALTVRQSLIPLTLVTLLFFLWGFAYGLLDVLNAKFQTALDITAAKAGGLQGAYFGAYFIGPLTYSGWLVRKFGYRWTFIAGLIIYGVGKLTRVYQTSFDADRRRCSYVLAIRRLPIFRWLLRFALHCRIRSIYS